MLNIFIYLTTHVGLVGQQSGGQRLVSSDDYGETIDFKRNPLGGNVSFPT